MPASQVYTDNGSDDATDTTTEGSPDQIEGAPAEGTEGEAAPKVHDYLEMALQAAADTGMSTSELMGIFFYYAHSIAESYRQDVLNQQEQGAPG
ncbi:MAG: hypothetical protein ACR2QK_08795 [Acidimicrobiales bacterium]